MNRNDQLKYLPVAGMFFFFFSIFGIILPYLSPLLLEMGVPKDKIGMIQSGVAFLLTMVPWMAGRLTDLFSTATHTLRLCGIGMLLGSILLFCFKGHLTLFIMALFIFSFCRAPVISLQDTLALQVGQGNPRVYSTLRMMGSLGFALTAVWASMWIKPGHYVRLLPLLIVLALVFSTVNFFVPVQPRPGSSRSLPFFKGLDRTWWLWLSAMSLHWLGFGPYNYGFTFLLTESAIPSYWHGWIWSLGVLTEILVFLFSGRIFRWLTPRQALFFAFGANLVRWAWTGLQPVPWVIVFCQTLHGAGFALFYAAALQVIRSYSRGMQTASFQGLFSTMVGGVSNMVGLFLAGQLHQRLPFHQVLLWMVPIELAAIIVLWYFPLRKEAGAA